MQSSRIGSSFKPPRNHPKLFSHHSVLDPKHKRESDFTISDAEVKLQSPQIPKGTVSTVRVGPNRCTDGETVQPFLTVPTRGLIGNMHTHVHAHKKAHPLTNKPKDGAQSGLADSYLQTKHAVYVGNVCADMGRPSGDRHTCCGRRGRWRASPCDRHGRDLPCG